MSSKRKADKAQFARRGTRTGTTLELRLDVDQRDPQSEVPRLFALAKSAGKELDVTFGHGGAWDGD
jgi:hypothetical protein